MNKYAQYTPQQLEELFSHFLIDSWSYSKVSTFARNEKEFERRYVYREPSRSSSSAVAGSAYHAAVEYFFRSKMEGRQASIVDMKAEAYAYIDNVPANAWKLQKTTPTIDACIADATKKANAYTDNFLKEIEVYEVDKIKRIIGVEMSITQWLTVNGVDIPLPCHAIIDLAIELQDGRIIIIDNKGKSTFTNEDEIALTTGKQAITYVLALHGATGLKADEVWFIENKHSTNKDGSPQLKPFRVVMDKDTQRLYEAMLYDPLKRMIEAVSNPDYVYMINDSDNWTDRAELYQFWAKTMIAEVDDFDIPENKKPLITARLKKIRDASLASINPKTINTFRKNAAAFITYDLSTSDMTNSEKIEHSLRTFGITVRVAHEIQGYSSDTYLMEAAFGTKISNIYNYRLDIANALNVSSVRIGKNLLVYEGKSYLYIEVAKKRTKTLVFEPGKLEGMKIPIGVDNFGRTVVWALDSHATPHMLICGATGSGKSVSIISTIEYALLAGIKDIHIMDPKYEFTSYNGKDGIKVYNEIERIEAAMAGLVKDMQSRAKTGRNSKTLVVVDEFADAVSAASSGAQLDIREEVNDGYYKNGNPKVKMVTVGGDK
jgi:hypothetical protein